MYNLVDTRLAIPKASKMSEIVSKYMEQTDLYVCTLIMIRNVVHENS